LTPRFSRQDARLVTVSRLPRHSIGATGSAPRAARSRKAGSFIGRNADIAKPFALTASSDRRRQQCQHHGADRRPIADVITSSRHRQPIMMFVQLGVLAAAEIAIAFHQIVRSSLYPCPEAVATKRCHRAEIVMNEIAPGGHWSAWKRRELQCLGHGLLPDLCIHPTATPMAVFDQDQRAGTARAGTGHAGSDRRPRAAACRGKARP